MNRLEKVFSDYSGLLYNGCEGGVLYCRMYIGDRVVFVCFREIRHCFFIIYCSLCSPEMEMDFLI